MKKALYVATVDVHIRTFHLPYLKMLHDNGYEVHVATNGDEPFPNCDVKHRICIERNPFKFNNLKAIKQLRKIIEKEKFDLVHCHTPMGSVVTRLAARHARKEYGTRVIYTAHGFHFYKGAPLINWVLFYPVEKYLAKFTDTLITINKEDFNLAKSKFSKRCADIHYIPGVGIDLDKYKFEFSDNSKEMLRKSLGLSSGDYLLIFPARLDKNKNQLFLINCMKALVKEHDNIHLILPGNDELNGYYQKITFSYGLEKNIHFLGFRSDVPKLLSISNLAVSSSIREGFGLNLVEALACHLPVVALCNRGHKDIIVDEKNGYLVSYDENLFVKKILNIYDGKIKLDPMYNIEKFSIKNSLEIVKKIYWSDSV